METLVLYGHPDSSNALKIRFLLAELGLAYEDRRVPLTHPRPAEYVSMTVLGRIPALVEGDLVLTESHAILRYLARRERSPLYPATDPDRARVDEFLDRFLAHLRPALARHENAALGRTPVGATSVRAPATRDPDAARRIEREIRPALEQLDTLVRPEGAVLGRFTIADCAIAPALHRTVRTGLDLAAYPNLWRLRSHLLGRPAWRVAGPSL